MPKHILVINDTQEILQLFEDILVGEGYKVTIHSYSTRDIEVVKKVNPDLIISDHPPFEERQGWQFLQKLKMDKQTARIPVVVCTTNSKVVQDIEGHLSAKGILTVPKPFDIEDLLEAVEHQIGKAEEPPTNTKTVKAHS